MLKEAAPAGPPRLLESWLANRGVIKLLLPNLRTFFALLMLVFELNPLFMLLLVKISALLPRCCVERLLARCSYESALDLFTPLSKL